MKTEPNSGLTLIEVMVAMALLGTLLVSLLSAHGRYASRIEQASQRIRIMRESEKLLATWYLQLGMVPVDDQGELLVGESTYRWKTSPGERLLDPVFLVGTVNFEVTSFDGKKSFLKLELAVPSWEN